MYLNALQHQNDALIQATLALHEQGNLLPDSYVIDVEQFTANAKVIRQRANDLGLKLYGMTKQFGRNPYLAQLLLDLGYDGIVAVDFKEARALHLAGVQVQHVGHLVQPPTAMVEQIVAEMKPEVMTVYSLDKARQISDAASKCGRVQPVLVKFYGDEDRLYVNQEAGFPIAEVDAVLEVLGQMKGIRLEGVTHFPCFLFDGEQLTATENVDTLHQVIEHWPEGGVPHQVNMPSATCCNTLTMIKRLGGTHGEPGHALTGTFPANIDGSQPEKVAMLYLSEVSHQFQGASYCYGGGYYRRGQLEHALIDGSVFPVSNEDVNAIDYHLKVSGTHKIGTPIIMAFRTQVFVTRSDVVLVDGIQSGNPRVIGRYDSLGGAIDG
ncbi:YhfX family PLP-dependent enzyme [Vibrio mediterranei]|uniref:YhfX family PLP-dependent enzyme n=1 Tax=Vibrio mediterranei TaxID=689 RepID=UPI00148B8950|nr:YhfX family PLP-dependent enzyme [Vibrio mediterranei]NOH27098.1 YhfX family PLP-dependent enzyme [Vibrio mediterranei]